MLELITPEKNLFIDESVMLWCGRLIFPQYIKHKRHKYEMKIYKFMDSLYPQWIGPVRRDTW